MSVSWATVNPTYSAATSECAEPATSASSATTSCFWVRLRAIALPLKPGLGIRDSGFGLTTAEPRSRHPGPGGFVTAPKRPGRTMRHRLARCREASRLPVGSRFQTFRRVGNPLRSEEHTSELQSLMRPSYDVI